MRTLPSDSAITCAANHIPTVSRQSTKLPGSMARPAEKSTGSGKGPAPFVGGSMALVPVSARPALAYAVVELLVFVVLVCVFSSEIDLCSPLGILSLCAPFEGSVRRNVAVCGGCVLVAARSWLPRVFSIAFDFCGVESMIATSERCASV